ncbi:hypothetical protein M430DRAFT_244119 [Amorphotheca resinae ATCC 22711]|uniref:Uncharacterized protein n=1 Tax=Amorphotheca resinae ATCC 22711 TaxID=857342 RepID=A0A2T3B2P4_AMORE|nr:hypothetical protein M430DRAFT_244119 [Amorphotheca resinae ATCC 22711]PSS18809.1 hypothetical protein M430DRAFT_244119 [Amorphotheca resinae ATCC 22711]
MPVCCSVPHANFPIDPWLPLFLFFLFFLFSFLFFPPSPFSCKILRRERLPR